MNERLPLRAQLAGEEVELRLLQAGDEPAVLAFAQSLPAHELVFLPRDIRQPKVVSAWVREHQEGALQTLLAWRGDEVIGCSAIARDSLSWSAHVAEIRTVIAPSARGQGLGTLIVQEAFRLAILGGAEKLFAVMTTDQGRAISVFEGLGFTPEAVLRNHVRDPDGKPHDLVVLSHQVAEVAARLNAYGLAEPDLGA